MSAHTLPNGPFLSAHVSGAMPTQCTGTVAVMVAMVVCLGVGNCQESSLPGFSNRDMQGNVRK